MSRIFIISAPSGAGKTSLVKKVCKTLDFVRPSVSFTTRKIRDSEQDKKDYFFIDKKEFEERISKSEFLEYQNVYGNLYGTTLDSISHISKQGHDVILEIDYRGMLAVKKVIPEAISIYIVPPSIEILRKRLENRAEDDKNVIQKRMRSSLKELEYSKYADYILINDDFSLALNSLIGIILFKKIPVNLIKDYISLTTSFNKLIV
ncbi:MAG: guanylate kinase [Gammaproteobacteria bacterium]|jgi:guanylate kinase|nr:guanylate kinase [Gammaproteobacteria bacterium]MDG2158976.1 guanylate kinase [Gammaproteobacteria bacterium]